MNSDAELLARYAREVSQPAFAELVQRHVNFVYGWALRRVGGNRSLAEDITQQVFVAFAREAGRLAVRDTLQGWLYIATRRVAATALRSEMRRRVREQAVDVMSENPPSPAETAETAELLEALAQLLDRLDAPDRDAVFLRYFGNRSYAEIGDILRLSEDGARSRVKRAVDQLRAMLERRGIRSTAAALTAAFAEQSLVAAPSGLAGTATVNALVTAAASSSSLAVVPFLMNSKTTAVMAGVAAAIGLGALVYLTHDVAGANSDVANASTANTALRAKVAAQATRANAAPVEYHSRALSTASPAGEMPRSEDPFTMADVRHRALLEIRNYGPLFERLGLSPAQIGAVSQRLAKTYLELQAINGNASKHGIALTDPAISAQRQAARAALHADLQTMIDSAAYQQLYEYSRTVAISSEVVSWIAKNVSDTPTPLTADQAAQLTQILANHSGTYRAGGEAGGDIEWAGVIADASPVLTPEQLTALKQRAAHLTGAWQGRIGMPWTLP